MKSALLALSFAWAYVNASAQAADTPVAAILPCPAAATAQSQDFDAARLCEVLPDFATGTANFHALVIERHGGGGVEAYRRGKDESIYSLFGWPTDFDATQRHDVRSISKSVTSLLWGIAQGQGKTPPLDTPVTDLLPELSDLKGQGREAITLSHLFDMSSGLDWNEPNAYNSSRNDELGLYWRSSQARYLCDRAVVVPPGDGGQRLFVVPELDMVMVITAGDYNQVAIARLANQLFRRVAATSR